MALSSHYHFNAITDIVVDTSNQVWQAFGINFSIYKRSNGFLSSAQTGIGMLMNKFNPATLIQQITDMVECNRLNTSVIPLVKIMNNYHTLLTLFSSPIGIRNVIW